MADGFKSAAQLVNEAIVKPVTDEVGKMVEEGVQSISGSQKQDDVKQNQQKVDPKKVAQDDAAKKRKALQHIQQFNQQFMQQQQALRMKRQQEKQEKNQEEVQQKEEIKQFEFAKKQQFAAREAQLLRDKTRSERKGGAG